VKHREKVPFFGNTDLEEECISPKKGFFQFKKTGLFPPAQTNRDAAKTSKQSSTHPTHFKCPTSCHQLNPNRPLWVNAVVLEDLMLEDLIYISNYRNLSL